MSVRPLSAHELALPPPADGSAVIAARVASARERQVSRFRGGPVRCNAEADGALLADAARPDAAAALLLRQAADRLGLSARAYHRVLRVARTVADLAGAGPLGREHVAEALAFRPAAASPAQEEVP